MTRLEFEQALDRWGTDFSQWPVPEADHARAYLATDLEGRRLLDAAQQVDVFLLGMRQHTPPAYLAGRILAHAAEPDRLEQMLGWFSARMWRPALFAVVVTTAGFLTGIGAPDAGVDAELAEDVMTLAFSDIYSELEDAQQ
jgi:hypothetical protein